MRLIDADAICKECIDEFLVATCKNCVIKEYKLNKSIDAVPVVRCGECKYRVSPNGDDAHFCRLGYGLQGFVEEEDFCSYGERKGGDGNG